MISSITPNPMDEAQSAMDVRRRISSNSLLTTDSSLTHCCRILTELANQGSAAFRAAALDVAIDQPFSCRSHRIKKDQEGDASSVSYFFGRRRCHYRRNDYSLWIRIGIVLGVAAFATVMAQLGVSPTSLIRPSCSNASELMWIVVISQIRPCVWRWWRSLPVAPRQVALSSSPRGLKETDRMKACLR
jgi:hypothetical protein